MVVNSWLVAVSRGLMVGVVFRYAPKVWRTMRQGFESCAYQVFLMYSDARSAYRWRLRLRTPGLLKPFGDWVFHLTPTRASVDSPKNVAESIVVVSASLTFDGKTTDVTERVQHVFRTSRLGYGSTKVALYAEDLLDDSGLSELGMWSLEIIYIGHADPSRRIPADEFAVKYVAKVSSAILFPPYEATEKIQKGLGTKKIIHARTFHEKNLTSLAKKYAGLRVNFYEDVQDSQVQKFHIDHQETHVLVSNKGAEPTTIVVSKKSKTS